MTSLAFTVPGAPVPKARPRVFGSRTITDPRTVAYEALVRVHALKARQQARRAGIAWPLDADYEMTLTCVMPTRRRADVDNLAKAALDACNGVLYDDDSQVSRLEVERLLASDEPRLVMQIEVRL